MADQIGVVSAERIAAEMRAVLTGPRRSQALRQLIELRLAEIILPEATPEEPNWSRAQRLLDASATTSVAPPLAAVLSSFVDADTARRRCRAWKLSNRETTLCCWLIERTGDLFTAPRRPWPRVQELLVHPDVGELLHWHDALASVDGRATAPLGWVRDKLALPANVLNPPPLLTGDDLAAAGFQPGPQFKNLLQTVRDAQLEGDVATTEEALALARGLLEAKE